MNKRLLLDPAPGGNAGGWISSLPDELKQSPSLQKFSDPAALAKSYVNLEQLVGTKRLPEPQPTWKDQEWDAFYTQLGRPSTPGDYKLPADIKLPEGVQLSDEKLAKANEALHKAGLTPKQHEAVMRYYAQTLGDTVQADAAAKEQERNNGTAKLKELWGDKYDANLDVAKSVVKKFGGDELMNSILKAGVANDPTFIGALHKIGVAMLDHKMAGGDGGGLQVMDSTAAQREIANLRVDKDFMQSFMSATDPGHAAAVSRWAELHQKAYPGQQG